MSDEVDDFVRRCTVLEKFLDNLREHFEPSDRVWVSVFTVIMKTLMLRQEHPEEAFENFMTTIKYIDPKCREGENVKDSLPEDLVPPV